LRLPDGGVKNLEVNLPKGVVVNPNATPAECSEAELESEACPPSSQIGTTTIENFITQRPGSFHIPLFNMKAPKGIPAVFGMEVEEGIYVHILGKVRSEEDYGLSAEVRTITSKVGVVGFETELWGIPTSSIHDGNRGECARVSEGLCPIENSERTEKPFLVTPTSCEGPLASTGSAVSYGHPDAPVAASSLTAPMSGCNQLEFDPSISAQPTTPVSEAPTGLSFDLHQRQTNVAEAAGGQVPLSTANLKDAVVTLPAGLVLNPSSANGLGSCTPAEIGLKTPVGQAAPTHFDEVLGGCPDASKLGTVEVDTPILQNPLFGSVYLATPYANPFKSLLAIYLAVEDERTGIVAKLPGLVESDPSTGQLTVTFRENPELPIEDVKLNIFNGPRAVPTPPPRTSRRGRRLKERTPTRAAPSKPRSPQRVQVPAREAKPKRRRPSPSKQAPHRLSRVPTRHSAYASPAKMEPNTSAASKPCSPRDSSASLLAFPTAQRPASPERSSAKRRKGASSSRANRLARRPRKLAGCRSRRARASARYRSLATPTWQVPTRAPR
jgi:hypothetical protein